MANKLPLWPTLVVALAIAVMIGLGIWQLQRRGEKEDLIARYAAASRLPPMAFPTTPVPIEKILFRRATGFCLKVTGWRMEGGRSTSGTSGYRHIAECSTGAEGPGLRADMGVAADPDARPVWQGGEVTGVIWTVPDHSSVLSRMVGRSAPAEPMLVSERPAPGLQPSQPPAPADVSNNHLYYALQWFFFAAAAAVIYTLALRRRNRAPDGA